MRTPLTPQETDRVFDLVAEAGALEPEQRAAFLAQACMGAEALRAEVESLLGFKTKAPDFLASPAFERGLELLGFSAGDDLKPGDTLGDYRVVSLLGSGGMGEVYLADDTMHGRQVALKLSAQAAPSDALRRHFRHERKVLAGAQPSAHRAALRQRSDSPRAAPTSSWSTSKASGWTATVSRAVWMCPNGWRSFARCARR